MANDFDESSANEEAYNEALKQLEEERTPLYEAAASVVLDNTGTLREAADKAAALFEADETL